MMMKNTIKKITGALMLLIALVLISYSKAAAQTAANQAKQEAGFDMELLIDFKRGMFGGDAAAMTRAMTRSEAILAKNPADAKTLAWHGSALLYNLKSAANRTGDFAVVYSKGLRELDDALTYAPDDVHVLSVRTATLAAMGENHPQPEEAERLRRLAARDAERIVALTENKTDTDSVISRYYALKGLTEGYTKAGNAERAAFYKNLLDKLPKFEQGGKKPSE